MVMRIIFSENTAPSQSDIDKLERLLKMVGYTCGSKFLAGRCGHLIEPGQENLDVPMLSLKDFQAG